MTLSVLTLIGGFGLYDSATQSYLITGTFDEMYEWKNKIEMLEQKKLDSKERDRLREERVAMLVKGGHTQERAIEFLKTRMPQLFINEITSS